MLATAKPGLAMRRLLLGLALAIVGAAHAEAAPIVVNGRVEAAGGGAVRDALVRLYPLIGSRATADVHLQGAFPPPHKAEAKVGADGTFRIEAPGPGVWHVVASAPGRAPLTWSLQPLVEETWLPTAELAADAPVEVVVVDAAGKPVKGAAVVVELADAPSFTPGWFTLPARLVTDAQGKAVAPRRNKARVDVTAAAPQGVVTKVTGVGGRSVRLTLAAGVGRELLLVDADGRPAAEALVMSSPLHAPVVTANAAGKAVVIAPAAEPLVVEVEGKTGAHARVTLEPPPKGETPKPLRVVLRRDPPLTGRVIDAQSRRPIAGAVVYVPARGELFAVSDGAGAFALERVPAGGMGRGLRAAAAGYLPVMAESAPAAAARRTLTLALQPAAALVGTVTDAKRRPVAGVEVNAGPAAPRSSPNQVMRRVGMMAGVPLQARTDERGRFRVAPLVKEVPYEVAFRRAGFAPLVRQVPPATRDGIAELHVTLLPGSRGVGRVTSLQGEAIAGAIVKLTKQEERGTAVMRFGERQKPDAETSSDSAGRFTLADLPAGRFTLEVTAPGFAGSKVPGIEVPANAGEVDLGTVKLAAGVPVEGRVVSLQGQPIEGAEVFVLEGMAAMMMSQSRWALMGQEPAATTAADGFFSVHDRAAGQKVDLAARRSGYTVERATGVTAPTAEPVVITLRPASDIRGRIVDPDGDAVANAQLNLTVERAGGGMVFMGNVGNTTSGDDGRFAIEDVDPGTVRISVSAAGFLPFERAGVEVPAGKDVEGLELVLKPGAVVEGMVTTPDGLPAIGAYVNVVAEQRGGVRSMRSGGSTDGEGRYRLDGVEPGPRTLEATHDDFARTVADLEVRPGENQLDLRLGGAQEVSGRVVGPNGQPVGAATVGLAIPGQMARGNPGAITDASGLFHIAGVPDGTYEATASHSDYGDGRTAAPLIVAGAPLTGVTIELPAGTVVTGALRGLSLAELGRTRVFAYQQQQRGMPRQGTVSYDGRYRIGGLSPGDWMVTAQLEEGSRHAQGRLVIAAGSGEETLDLDFEGGLTLHGRVRENGRALDGAAILVRGKDVPGGSNARTDQAGAYRAENLKAGSYDVEVFAPLSGLRKRQTVTIERDQELDFDLRSTRLSGRVLESGTGDPIAGASIRVETVEEERDRLPFGGNVTTDEGGRFSLVTTGEGTWRLLVEKVGYARAETRVQVGSEPIDDVEIRLSPTQGLVLQVSGTAGTPPAGVLVAVLNADGAPLFSESYGTGEGGRVRLSTVPPGSWEVLVRTADSATARVVATSPGPPVPVMLAPQATLVLVVPDLIDEAVVAKAAVTGSDGRPFAAPVWGGVRREFDVAYGRATITGLPSGAWEVGVVAPDGRRWRGSAVTTPGATATVELD